MVHQPRTGFRYSVDAFWLAGFALEDGVPATALDLGTGSGIVAFLLAFAGCETTGIDALPAWAEGWRSSFEDSAVRPELHLRDVREAHGRHALVTCNPPYFPAGTGPVSPDPFRAAARTEGSATLADFAHAAVRSATERAVFVLPVERQADLLAAAAPLGLHRRLQVGRKRVLLDLRPDATLTEDASLPRDHPRVTGFVERFRGGGRTADETG